MRIKTIAASVAALSLTAGCASVGRFTQEHPVVTAVGVAVVMGSFAASQQHGGHRAPVTAHNGKPCRPSEVSC